MNSMAFYEVITAKNHTNFSFAKLIFAFIPLARIQPTRLNFSISYIYDS